MALWRLFRRPRAAPCLRGPADLLPVQDAQALLAPHRVRIDAIRRLVGVPDLHWERLYAPMFARYAELVQQLPACDPHPHAEAGGLLARALVVTEQALKRRRASLLPPGAGAEDIARRADLWTYATAACALLHGLGTLAVGQEVTLYDARGRPLGLWVPWTGSMGGREAAWYSTRVRSARYPQLQACAPLLLSPVVMPAPGIEWLSSDLAVFEAWTAALSGDLTADSVLMEIVRQADALSNATDLADAPSQAQGTRAPRVAEGLMDGRVHLEEAASRAAGDDAAEATVRSGSGIEELDRAANGRQPRPPSVAEPPGAPAAEDAGIEFLEWVREGLRRGELSMNSPQAPLHTVAEGLLLVSPALFQAFDSRRWAEVQKRFQKLKLHQKGAQGRNIHRYVACGDGKSNAAVSGFLIANPAAVFPGIPLPPPNPHLRLQE